MSDTQTNPSPSTPPPIPDALLPYIPIGKPNESFTLYAGPIDFTQSGITFRTDGRIYLEWYPYPEIRLEVPNLPANVVPSMEDISFRLDDGTMVNRVQITGLKHTMGPEVYSGSISGVIRERVIRPADSAVNCVMFLLPNFRPLSGQPARYPDGYTHSGRLILRAGGWIITLDAVSDQKAIIEQLESHSGFGITHIGKLEKDDGKSFSAQTALEALYALAWYGSFAAGQWTGPYLSSGFDNTGKQIWQIWDCPRTVPYRSRQSWLDIRNGRQFEEPFSGFMKLWPDEDWKEVVLLAFHWFIEANALAGSVEGSIVLTQTAFELLASAILVEHYGWLSTDGFEKIPAADRIRLLFLWAGIPIIIPGELEILAKQAKAENWPDTATAMTMIRNTITHPTKKNRDRFGKHLSGARTEAWMLGMWNLELCLLRLFEYRGTYHNRITQKWAGDVKKVPWAI